MSSPLIQLALKNSIGSKMIGFMVSAIIDSMLMGVVIVQAVSYCRYARTDKKHIVAIVAMTIASTVIATVFLVMWVTHLFVWNFGDYIPFTEVPYVIREFAIGMATVVLVQTFYIDRACRLYQHWWPAMLLGPFVGATFSLGIATLRTVTRKYDRMSPTVFEDPDVAVLAYSWLGFVLASDLLITLLVANGLRRVKTGWSHTDSVLRRLIILCFETQTPALISSAATLIAWQRRYDIGLIFVSIQSKIYTVGLLTTLNFRGTSANSTSSGSYGSKPPDQSHPMHILSHSHSLSQAQAQAHLATEKHAHRRHDVEMESAQDEAEYASTTALRR
ncbi:uncharacterized protein MKK02DRAFT_29185 [Dioszegia hungarica]|uniref:DUF6534 domain-containing protein n=1 Tax=Dioszegia hungarica TaxID=4972 RepID=A0AA38H6E1_9TREE|nr:uncharacterized protein MKK02DRAFT_29185 [Dioszegia hungarica]KAI9633334.1 hypothetical protein MKK02DRAFT_29185 [Dioszegia hungarica]